MQWQSSPHNKDNNEAIKFPSEWEHVHSSGQHSSIIQSTWMVKAHNKSFLWFWLSTFKLRSILIFMNKNDFDFVKENNRSIPWYFYANFEWIRSIQCLTFFPIKKDIQFKFYEYQLFLSKKIGTVTSISITGNHIVIPSAIPITDLPVTCTCKIPTLHLQY